MEQRAWAELVSTTDTGAGRPGDARRFGGRSGPRPTTWVGAAVVAALAAVLLLPLPARAQTRTGLLVLGGTAAREAGAVVRWTHGPVEVTGDLASDGQEWAEALRVGVEALVAAGAFRVVVVPVPPPGSARGPWREALAIGDEGRGIPSRHGPGVTVRPPVNALEVGDARALARRIEGRARRGLRELGSVSRSPGEVFELDALNVTATRTTLDVFGTAAPVTVVDEDALDRRPRGGPIGALADVPGVELDGVGALRAQPVIRGFTGQRVLLLEDGLRLSNARRRLGSVEPAALVGSGTVERIEVVRGPASVLYGSDAIGGVVNLVTRGARAAAPPGVAGSVRLSGSTAGQAGRVRVSLHGRGGPAGLRVSAGARTSGSYRAPEGRFGGVRLPEGAVVHDTGVRDRHARAELETALGAGTAFLRAEGYRARDSGFGYVDPSLLSDDPTRVRLTFPDHRFGRLVAGWRSDALGLGPVDGVEATFYAQQNERDFVTDVLAHLGPGAPPEARLQVVSENHTDLRTLGGRVEVATWAADDHRLTWGVEAHRDRSQGSDTTTTTLTGLGPPNTSVREDSAVPDATLSTVGLFLQDRWTPTASSELTAGARYQESRARARQSAARDGSRVDGSRHVDRTVVGSASLLHRVAPHVAVVASVARGFRSPNLVERFFSGPTPGGRGVWLRNPELDAEKSVTVDLGVRLRRGALQAELFAYRTSLFDGIRLEPTGSETETGPEYRNENVAELAVRGLEGWARWSPAPGWSATLWLDVQDRTNPDDPDDPLVEGSRHRLAGSVRYSPVDRLTFEYRGRYHGAQRETLGRQSPVGAEAPAYSVHDLWGSVTLAPGHTLTVAVENALDRLYARAANVGFFRPEPGRTLTVGLTSRF